MAVPQSHSMGSPSCGSIPLDGLGSDDPAVLRASADLFEDEQKFIDHPNSPMWIAQESVVIG